MTTRQPRVVVTRRLTEPVEARMRALFDVELNADDVPLSPEALTAAVQNADVLVPTLTDVIDKALIDSAGERLKLIANFGAGVDHIDVAAAHARGVHVTNTPGVLTEDTADMAMALILASPRRLGEGVRALAQREFPGWSPTWMLGRRISGKALGIVGMGRIGQAIARRARAFGMSERQVFRRIHLPQMWTYALPGLSNLWMVLIKATPLLFLLGIEDIVYWARELGGAKTSYFEYPHPDWRLWYFLALLVFYLIMTRASETVFKTLTARVSKGQSLMGQDIAQ